MRKSLIALLLLLGAAASMATLAMAQASGSGDVGEKLFTSRAAQGQISRAARQSPAKTALSDSFWIGHSIQTVVPGVASTYNYGPYHVGRGLYRPSVGAVPAANNSAVWDWDHFNADESDSLMGWWPIRRAYDGAAGPVLTDVARPWLAGEVGNQGCYAMNSPASRNGGAYGKKNFGVIGYWHVDPGNAVDPLYPPDPDANQIAGTNAKIPQFATAGGGAAWCGLRGHGDLIAVDPISGNPYNMSVLEYNGINGGTLTTGTDKGYPGYPSQMDQFLYTDIEVTASTATLDLAFLYETAMSTLADGTSATRTGWFEYDPTVVGAVSAPSGMNGAPNFISNTGIGQPADSFMVYIGVPVDINAVRLAKGGGTVAVYDLKRRWLSEILRIEAPIKELPNPFSGGGRTFGKSGFSGPSKYNTDPTDLGSTDGRGGPIALADFYNAAPGSGTKLLRVVIRCHTNRGFDDNFKFSFDSQNKGAVVVDNVNMTVHQAVNNVYNYDFNTKMGAVGCQIDNSDLTDDASVGSWRSTGKPPSVFFHAHALVGDPRNLDQGRSYKTLEWHDVCGPITSAARFCNMAGVVMSVGNHDNNEGPGGAPNVPADFNGERDGIISPTVNLMNTGLGDANANAMGIDLKAATASDDYYNWYDFYSGAYDLRAKGCAWQFGFQSYPAAQADGAKCWGELRTPSFQYFDPPVECNFEYDGGRANGLIATTNADLVPDSIRIFIGNNSQCYRFSTVTSCPTYDGSYFDNAVLLLAAAAEGGTASVTSDIWAFINDAFPTNDNTSGDPGVAVPPGDAKFDTCGANLTNGINISTQTGDVTRPTIPGDTMYVKGDVTGSTTHLGRVDLVFRIKPGVGNYATVGDPFSGLLRTPSSPAAGLAVKGVYVNDAAHPEKDFWAAYLNDPGLMGSTVAQGQHGLPANYLGNGNPADPNFWNRNVWNSARCDTADRNVWAVESNANVFNLIKAFGGAAIWMAAYHEDDPKYALLGITHNICFLNDPNGAVNMTNIVCDPSGAGAYGAVPTTTKEGSKIIPDGLLTPGAHVEYFFRGQTDDGTGDITVRRDAIKVMCPETTFVSPQNTEASTDGHRWQEFSVLPDRWKNPTFGDYDDAGTQPHSGSMACMLYVDNCDRRGPERTWVSIADSLGATSVSKRGAHNGWRANGGFPNAITTSLGEPINVSTDPSIARYTHGGQPGSTWDMYGVKASESLTTSAGSFGARLGPAANNFALGKDGKSAPTPAMLKAYYQVLLILTGDLESGALGPFADHAADDVALLNDYTVGVWSPVKKRAVLIGGDGFVQSETSGHAAWLGARWGVKAKNGGAPPANQFSYKAWAGNDAQYADLITAGPIQGSVESVGNSCLWTLDVLDIVTGGPAGTPVVSAYYQNTGAGNHGPYIAGVYTAIGTGKDYESFLDGFDIRHVFSYSTFTSAGRMFYYTHLFNQIAATSGLCQIQGTPLVDVPPISAGQEYVDFMQIRNNPMLTGRANVHFGLAHADRVTARVFDVSGRLVRTLADRNFQAGEHDLFWDGTDDGGRRMERGVYFTQLKYARTRFVDAKKITVLK